MDHDTLVQGQLARAEEAVALARQKTEAMAMPDTQRIQALLKSAARTNRPGKRIRLLLEAADAYVAPAVPLAPCRQGCAHCCHQSVQLTLAEARNLAEASGSPMSIPDFQEPPLDPAAVAGTPCPFLVDNRCSVYLARPMACRLLVALDRDELLCRITPGHPSTVPVPYLDTRQFQLAAAAQLLDQPVADIRQFFPSRAPGTLDHDAGRHSSGCAREP